MATPDRAVRERALSLDASFIVQAPAGSGKTGLLTQRLLRLLSVVDQPEEILAITFTRKAAAEMRARVLKALHEADADSAEERSDHGRRTRALAQAACRRSEAQGWQLLADPSRLKIMTFDALNIRLAGTLPLTAGSAVTLQPVEDAGALHRAAAREVLALAGEDDHDGAAVRLLLAHLDSDGQRFIDQLAAELARRDQWLRHVLAGTRDADHRGALEAALGRMVASRLVEAVGHLPARCVEVLPVLMTQAAREATDAAVAARFARLPDIAAGRLLKMPPAAAAHVGTWRAGAALLLTGKGDLRKTIDKRCGFPPQAAELKAQAVSLLDALSAQPTAVSALQQIAALPDPALEDSQWQLLEALGRVLTLASAALRLLGSERGETDFIELALAAQRALGEATEPSDFALAMDFRLRHLLVDEFQDTSHGQFELLRRLVAGWTPGDGRTLFCVGDPMQSIYRFREADVGLFLQARRHGLGGVALEPLHLTANFRSAPLLVDWVNELFARLMPAEEDLATGAAPYTPAVAALSEDAGAAAEVSVLRNPDEETTKVVDWLRAAMQNSDEAQSIAVLVRNRRHMQRILPALRDEGLPVEAIAFEPLADSPAVQDLIALTRALTHLDDRVAWLAVLRSPCFGLSLTEIHTLVYDAREQVILDVLADAARLARLEAATRDRVVRGRGVLEHWLSRRGELRLAALIEGCWLALGGPATLSDARDLDDCHALLRRIASLQQGCDLPDPAELPGQLARLFRVHPSPARRCIQVMTIHHAKGLEFDHVVVCGLGEAT
ncbi:MAG: UvrD-helicase domain-containing protein, partial [Gammaproteobacteria bacterium]|nr:UvrD-helicase domain-containing protein [Gammaproteobacteria bacterium]